MKKIFRYTGALLFFLLLSFGGVVRSQTYPVQVNVYTVPPYGSQLTDYYATSREKLVVTLLNRDLMKPTLEVRLRLSVTCLNGASFTSKEEAVYPTITLDAGIPARLTQGDLAPYFEHV
ncbi:MAG: hypothetical protein LBN24_08450, partial [Mediterranea sp.]|nr:hypothetical protein [Mediterranea sp.]